MFIWELELRSFANEKKRVLQVLFVIVLLFAVHLYDLNESSKAFYNRSYKLLSQQLQFADM